jgi:hypothetical protein
MIVHYLVYYRPSDGAITRVCSAGGTYPPEGSWAEDNNLSILHVNYHIPGSLSEWADAHWIKNDSIVEREPPPDGDWEWHPESEEWIIDVEKLWTRVRATRDTLLAQCDWTQMPDTSLDAETQGTWTMYREDLRNVPQNNELATCYEEVTWPTHPSEQPTEN